MNLHKLKALISTNIFAFSGWLLLLSPFVIKLSCSKCDGNVIGFLYVPIYVSFYLLILVISIILYVIETSRGYKIKNKFILENIFYNFLFIFGSIVSAVFVLFIIISAIVYLLLGGYATFILPIFA